MLIAEKENNLMLIIHQIMLHPLQYTCIFKTFYPLVHLITQRFTLHQLEYMLLSIRKKNVL